MSGRQLPWRGGVDVAVKLSPSFSDEARQSRWRDAYIRAELDKGWSFRDRLHQVLAPSTDLCRFLRQRLPSIALVEFDGHREILERTLSLVLYANDHLGPEVRSVLPAEDYTALVRLDRTRGRSPAPCPV